MALKEWTNVSTGPVSLASGQPLAPGEHGPSDMKHPNDQAARDAGLLAETETKES